MGALPSWAPGGQVPTRSGGVTASRLPGWGRRRVASGMGSVETVAEGGSDHLRGCPASVVLVEEHNGYIVYPLQEVGPLGRIHADRWLGVRSMQVRTLGIGIFQELPQGAISAMRAFEEMGWLPEFVRGVVWRCAKWPTSHAVARPYAGLEELRIFLRECDGKAQWTVCGMAVLSFTCLLRVGEAAPIRRAGSRAWGFTLPCVTRTLCEGSSEAMAGRGGDGWSVRGPRPRSHCRTFAHKGPPTSRWSWQLPSADLRPPTHGGMPGGGVGRWPYARWVCRSDGLPGRVGGCQSRWRPTMVTP